MDNSDIIRRCAESDREAMESLYRLYARRLMHIIHRYVSEEGAAQDILHDGFVIILTRISELRTPSKLEFWMGTIMKNLCLDYLSQLDITTMLDEEIDFPEVPDMEETLSYDELSAIINRLPEGYRNVFKLAVLEHKSHAEIGRILGIYPHTSSSQLYRAKLLLQKMIRQRKAELGLLSAVLLLGVGGWLLCLRPLGDTSVPHVGELRIAEVREKLRVVERQKPAEEATAAAVRQPQVAVEERAEEPVVSTAVEEAGETRPADQPPTERRKEQTQREPSEPLEPLATSAPTPVHRRKQRDWIAGIGYGSVMVGGNLASDEDFMNFDSPSSGDPASPPSPPPPPIKPAIYNEDVDHDMPLTLALSISRYLGGNLSVESGVSCTILRTKIRYTGPQIDATRRFTTTYLGIPLKLNYRFFHSGRFSAYATVGAQVDLPLFTRVSTRFAQGEAHRELLPAASAKIQYSLLVGLGLQYSLTDNLSLFAEPSARYFFDNHSSLPTYWEEHPYTFSLPIGLRLSW